MLFGCFYLLPFIDGVLKQLLQNFMNFFTSPLEQFQVLPIISASAGFIDCSITNETIILALVFFFSITLFYSLFKQGTNSYFIIPNR